MLTLGFIMFAIAALIAMTNFYLSFIRAPIYWRLGWECRNISGIPLIGTLFLVAAVTMIEWSAIVWLGVTLLCIIDTGGLVWFCLVMMWKFVKK